MRVAKSLAVVAILAGSISLAGCGGDEGSASGAAPDARTLLSETFSPKGGSAIKSATVELTVSGKLSGSSSGSGSGDLKLSVDQAKEKGQLPDFQAELAVKGSSGKDDLDLNAGATYSGGRFYLSYDGQDYDAGEQLSKQIAQAAQQSLASGSTPGQGAAAQLGLDPGTWFTAPKVAGTDQVGGTDTYRITGDVNLEAMVPDILDAARKAQSVAGAAGGQQVPQITDEQLQSASKQVKKLELTVWTGKDDRILRQLTLDLSLDGDKQGDNLSGTIQLTLTAVNEEQKITAPSSTKPLTELPQLGALLGAAGGLSGGASGSSSGSSGAGAGAGSGEAGAAAAAYAACVSQAGTDPAKLNECQRLVTP